MTGDVHQISAEIGGLKASVDHLTRTLDNLSHTWAVQENAANEGRRKLHDKFETITAEAAQFRNESRTKMDALSLRVDGLAAAVRVIEPTVKDFNEKKIEERGARKLGNKLIAALTVAAGGLGWGAHELINYAIKVSMR